MKKQIVTEKRLSVQERTELLIKIEQINERIEEEVKRRKESDPEYQGEEEDLIESDPEEEYLRTPEGYLSELCNQVEEIEEKLYADDYEEKLLNYRMSYDKERDNYAFGNVISDVYSDISDDSLSRGKVAKIIADIWFQSSTKGAFNVGIIGKWGSGKTTFIECIKKNISEHKDSKRVLTVDYNASEYEDAEKIWASLAKKLFDTYEKNVCFPKTKYFLAKLSYNKARVVETAIIKSITVIALILMLAISKELYSCKQLIGYATGIVAGCGSLALAITQIVIPFLKSSINTATSLSDEITKITKLPSYKERLGTRGEISEDIEILFNAWFKKKNTKKKKVVVFVDELDRCTEEGVKEFFQSIQLFLNNKNINFVFAIDPAYLKKVIKKLYEVEEDKVEQYTNDYLEKYISIVVPLNVVMDYSNYIDNIVRNIEEGKAKKCFFNDEIKTIKRCIAVIDKTTLTPRKVKKILNALVLVKEYCVKSVNGQYAIDFSEFATWFIFSIAYPREAQLILKAFNSNKIHFPLGKILESNSSIMKKIGNDKQCRKYISFMETYVMADVNLYRYIAELYGLNI